MGAPIGLGRHAGTVDTPHIRLCLDQSVLVQNDVFSSRAEKRDGY